MKTCETCAAFYALGNECRMKPPTPALVPTAAGSVQIVGMYPPTSAGNWCLDWRERHDESGQSRG